MGMRTTSRDKQSYNRRHIRRVSLTNRKCQFGRFLFPDRSASTAETGHPEKMDEFPVSLSEVVCLGASFALSGICYYLYRKSCTTVDMLHDAPHFNIDRKLKDILNVTPGACLTYAVIEGSVQPLEEPLTSHYQKESIGVLQKFMLREHRRVWNGLSRTWTDSERVLHERFNTVPFGLVGPDETTVEVLCPLQASGVHMEMTHQKFHQATSSLGDLLGQYLSGEKLKGQLETEDMLKVGTILTGVGELVLDANGTLSLRPPSNGADYILSITDFDTLLGEHKNTASWWKTLAIVFALAGAAVILWVGRSYYHQLKVRWELERERRLFERLRDEGRRAEAAATGPDAPQDAAEERIENACVICLTQQRDCILLDCGHVCCCYQCYQALPQPRCPICRQMINRVVPLYHV